MVKAATMPDFAAVQRSVGAPEQAAEIPVGIVVVMGRCRPGKGPRAIGGCMLHLVRMDGARPAILDHAAIARMHD